MGFAKFRYLSRNGVELDYHETEGIKKLLLINPNILESTIVESAESAESAGNTDDAEKLY